ncbi:hypothetical protein D3C72_1898450 [compost metagenome]
MMVAYRIKAVCWSDKITWYQFCSLVDQLIKSMLSVCSRFTPNDRSCLVVYTLAIPVYIFPIALHIPLLEIGCKTV